RLWADPGHPAGGLWTTGRLVESLPNLCPVAYDTSRDDRPVTGWPDGFAHRSRGRRSTVDPVAIVADEVRELIRRRGLDPTRDVPGVRRLIEDAIADYDERS